MHCLMMIIMIMMTLDSQHHVLGSVIQLAIISCTVTRILGGMEMVYENISDAEKGRSFGHHSGQLD